MSTQVQRHINKFVSTNEQIILEIGCGDGRHLVDLRKRHLNLLVGAEYSYEFFMKSMRNKNSDINFIQCDAVYLPFKDNSADIIYSNSFFEHVYNPCLAVQEQYRSLKPTGHIIILVANLLSPKSFYNLFIRYFIKSRLKRGGVKWLFNKGKVEDNIYKEQYDFKIIKQKDEDLHSIFWWKKFLKSALPKGAQIIHLSTSRCDELFSIFRPILKYIWGGLVIVIRKSQ